MKKALVCYIFISIALLSCKKDHHTSTTEPTGKLYPVSFNISSFTQVNVPVDQNSKTKVNDVAPSASNLTQIVYTLFDSNNKLKKTVYIPKGAPNFGTFTDSIPSGNYTAVFLGATVALNPNDNHASSTPPTFIYYQVPYPETFYNKVSFTVGNTPVQQGIVLKRMTSELYVNIKDSIPPNARYLEFHVTGLHNTCNFLDAKSSLVGGGGETYIANTLTSADIGKTNFQMGMRIFNNTSSVTAWVVAKDVNGSVITQKYIYNITLQANTRTILTGNVFKNSGGTGGITVTFNPNYNTTDITQSF